MYTTPRASKRYTNGVEYFLDLAFEKSSQNGTILCPCIDCQSLLFAKRAVVYDHLICSGFKRGYLYWKDHGEVHEAAPLGNRWEDEGIYQHDMHGLLDDLFSTLPMEGNNADTSEGEENTSLNTERVKNDGTKSNDLLKDVEQEQQVIFHVARVKVCLVAMVTNSISRSKRVL
ncbi:reverse transcriptase domain-containing protein [Tanacetum coccineum]